MEGGGGGGGSKGQRHIRETSQLPPTPPSSRAGHSGGAVVMVVMQRPGILWSCGQSEPRHRDVPQRAATCLQRASAFRAFQLSIL